MPTQKYHLIINGKTLGPYAEGEIITLFRRGLVTVETLACYHVPRPGWTPPADLQCFQPLRLRLPRVLSEPVPEATGFIVECPSCSTRLRLRAAVGVSSWRCATCAAKLRVSIDASGNCHVESDPVEQEQADPPPPNQPVPKATQTPHEILGIRPSASVSEIKAAWKKRLKEYHPDRVAELGPELRALAEEKSKQINHAYETLIASLRKP